MYNLKFESFETGNSLELKLENNIVISHIEGVTGQSVALGLAQGFQQIGSTVISSSVSGMTLTVNGFIFDADTTQKRLLLRTFAPFVKGRLWWEDEYFIDVVVKDSPTISQEKHSTFSFRLYSELPFWSAKTLVSEINGAIVPSFSFPINYATPHKFGERNLVREFSVVNPGDVDTSFEVQISGTEEIVNPQIESLTTGEKLIFNGTIAVGEVLRLYKQGGKLKVKLVHSDESETNEFSLLDDESSLFTLSPGVNMLKSSAKNGTENMVTSVSFYPLYSGVLADGV